ncbi:MAG: M15 family metallopeptidase [Labilithrix sp.]|nr:M15 family metallopeptidase [Labilithrix sp.]MCW5817135.1 M15 family metallopeptidase [Labilithrix sp.]
MTVVRRSLIAAPFLCLLGATALPARSEEPKPAEPKESVGKPKESAAEAALPAAANKLTIELDGKKVACREQGVQPFLVRGNWFPKTNDPDKLKEAVKMLQRAIDYRTEKYGYFEPFGNAKLNAHPPKFYAKSVNFMGLSLQLNGKIIPAVKCVEAALKSTSAGSEYTPRTSSGMRFKNTYKGAEVSNHLYGIAIDIEPDRNKCCGCVAPWNEDPVCKKTTDVWKRMVMPKSWVDTFEKYGFYWLGHDVLQDTMHFEFLGDPDKIIEALP